ncbi:hypothetical protein L1987_63998 [Smallanthus sonchifolius]|uniref:Uncharacterized protein n=1 Tax=Smallanthus sonchifolius TaxID=185202 RepID=A0ACB9CEV7_9ASTR|nr:hypothetical protein L1987_63998 [Smallanthus sonchifolius]
MNEDSSVIPNNNIAENHDVCRLMIGETNVQQIHNNQIMNSSHNFYYSPNGTQCWVPNVAGDVKPFPGMAFEKWGDVASMTNMYHV